MNSTRSGWLTPQFVLGLFIIVLGVLFTLDNLGRVDIDRFTDFWPLVLVGIGLVKLGQHSTTPGRLGAALWILVGAWILAWNLDAIPFAFWDFWPLLLILAGASVLWRTWRRHERPAPPGDAVSTITAFCLWSGADRKSNSPDFRGGELTAIMGGVDADLTQAKIKDGEAVLDVFAFWGGIDIKVPADWTVVCQVNPFMGAYEDNTKPPTGNTTQRLVLRGLVVMGGIEVNN